MKWKTIVSVTLLLFALAGLAALALRGFRAPVAASVDAPDASVPAGRDRTIAYYLYGNFRCVTCRSMENMTEAAIKTGFGAELAAGALEFKIDNFERPGNERFAKDYKIIAASVLLIKERSGGPARWKILEKTWELCRESEQFQDYIRAETRAFLSGEGGTPANPAPAPADLSWTAMLLAACTAFGLGLLTALSPCPLTTNVAAISFLSRRAGNPRQAVFSGLLYSLGRIAAYVILGAVIVAGLLSTPGVAGFLSKFINALLGPLLIAAGLFLLDFLQLSLGRIINPEKLQSRAEKGGLWTAALLGFLFALAFCPTSVALFFGGLIPLSIKSQSSILLPALYGFATGLPVVVFAVLLAFAAQAVGRWFQRLSQIEAWLRRAAGAVFLAVGIYFTLLYGFGVGQ